MHPNPVEPWDWLVLQLSAGVYVSCVCMGNSVILWPRFQSAEKRCREVVSLTARLVCAQTSIVMARLFRDLGS